MNPSKANDPGLIYDIQPGAHPSLCGLNYAEKELALIVNRIVKCLKIKSMPDTELSYPSFSVVLRDPSPHMFTRTVTNVGQAKSNYTVEVIPLQGVNVIVNPNKLKLTQLNQKQTYFMTFLRNSSLN